MPALDPADLAGDIVVAAGYEYVADGNHRIAGMARWALEQGIDIDEEWVGVPVVLQSREETNRREAEGYEY